MDLMKLTRQKGGRWNVEKCILIKIGTSNVKNAYMVLNCMLVITID